MIRNKARYINARLLFIFFEIACVVTTCFEISYRPNKKNPIFRTKVFEASYLLPFASFPGRWQQRHTRGHQAQCCSRRGERILLQRARQRIRRRRRSRSLLAPPHTRLGLLYPAEYRLPTPNSCAELDETRRPSSDPPFTTTPERGCRGSCFTTEDRDLKILVQ